MFFRVFNPAFGTNQVLTTGAASLIVVVNKDDDQVRIVNSGASKAYVRFYSSLTVPAPAATTADACVAAGQTSTFTKGQVNDRVAYISAGGTTLDLMTGNGV